MTSRKKIFLDNLQYKKLPPGRDIRRGIERFCLTTAPMVVKRALRCQAMFSPTAFGERLAVHRPDGETAFRRMMVEKGYNSFSIMPASCVALGNLPLAERTVNQR